MWIIYANVLQSVQTFLWTFFPINQLKWCCSTLSYFGDQLILLILLFWDQCHVLLSIQRFYESFSQSINRFETHSWLPWYGFEECRGKHCKSTIGRILKYAKFSSFKLWLSFAPMENTESLPLQDITGLAFEMLFNRDAPVNCNDIVNYFIAICQGDHPITKSLLSTQYCKLSTVLLYFPIVVLVITISLLFSGASLILTFI